MKVSVLINNFNYGPYLDDCFQALANQTRRPDEVIFYDDGSSDNSLEVAAKYPFVKIISNPNFGQKPAFNQANGIYQALQQSTGEIIFLLDSDDYFEVEKIGRVLREFDSDPEVVFVQDAFMEFYEDRPPVKKNNTLPGEDYRKLYYRENWSGYFNPTSTMAFKRWYLEKMLPIAVDENWRTWSDVRLSRPTPFFGKTRFLTEALTWYRRHGKNDSAMMNQDHEKTLSNQTAHHEYLNLKLQEMGHPTLNFKKSIPYKRYALRTKYPEKLIRYLLWPAKLKQKLMPNKIPVKL